MLWPSNQNNKTEPFRVLIQRRDRRTSGRLAFYHTLVKSKSSCTGGVGHFPNLKSCPSAVLKRPASAETSSNIVTILRLGGWGWNLELKERKQLESSEQSLQKDLWAGGSLWGQSSHSACWSPASARATGIVSTAGRPSSPVNLSPGLLYLH